MSKAEREQIYETLKAKHYNHAGNWRDVEANLEAVSRYVGCSVDVLREIMQEIEAEARPAPVRKVWRNIESRKKCRTCGEVIGFAKTENGKLMPVNLLDGSTHWGCEKPGKRKKRGKK